MLARTLMALLLVTTTAQAQDDIVRYGSSDPDSPNYVDVLFPCYFSGTKVGIDIYRDSDRSKVYEGKLGKILERTRADFIGVYSLEISNLVYEAPVPMSAGATVVYYDKAAKDCALRMAKVLAKNLGEIYPADSVKFQKGVRIHFLRQASNTIEVFLP